MTVKAKGSSRACITRVERGWLSELITAKTQLSTKLLLVRVGRDILTSGLNKSD